MLTTQRNCLSDGWMVSLFLPGVALHHSSVRTAALREGPITLSPQVIVCTQARLHAPQSHDCLEASLLNSLGVSRSVGGPKLIALKIATMQGLSDSNNWKNPRCL